MTDKLNLVQKLAAVGMEISGVDKAGENKSKDGKINYKYVKAADVAKEIRQKLFTRNIILTIDEKEITTQGSVKTYSGGELPLVCVKSDFTFHDGDSSDKLTISAYGIAMDSGDKAIYKAKTGALKYVLRGIALIPDEKDDPEHDVDPEQVNTAIAEAEARFTERDEAQQRIAPFQKKALEDAYKSHGWPPAQVAIVLDQTNTYVQLEEVQKQHFQALLKAFSSPPPVPQDLVPALQRSVESAFASKSMVAGGVRVPINQGLCDVCGSKIVPAGVSKKTGKKYGSFCSNDKCTTHKRNRPTESEQLVDAELVYEQEDRYGRE